MKQKKHIKILQPLLQDFYSASDLFGTLFIKLLKAIVKYSNHSCIKTI